MTGRVGASDEVLKHHVSQHRAGGCPSAAGSPTLCDRCGAVLLLSCADCRWPLLLAAAAPCGATGEAGLVPYGAATSGAAA